MATIGTLFTGFDGVGIGARQAGLELAWGIEIDARLAEVVNANLGSHVHVASVLDCDPLRFDVPDVLHVSPPCTNASVANANAGETELGKALARKVAEFVAVLRPSIFTLENVWMYRTFDSWRIIADALYGAGYWLTIDHVNAANFSVPQTRKRMIVRAIKNSFVPHLPEPMPWIGWYAAIEDLLDTLPESQFAPWQLARLPVTMRSFLAMVQGEGGSHVRHENEPTPTLAATHSPVKYRAWLVSGQNARANNGIPTIRDADSPSPTITNQAKGYSRALLEHGRVVSMTPRALARFQTFPDWYALPDNARLAAKGIGNAVPPLLYQQIISQLLER